MAAPRPVEVYGGARLGLVTRVAGRLAARARRRRHRMFLESLGVRPGERILDVGCGSAGLRALDDAHEIVGVDLRPQPNYIGPPTHFVRADAAALPFGDGEFDVVHCNSLIEHVDPAERPHVAAEITRVGRRYFVQTPYRWFPIEPHVLLPLFQFLPRPLRRRLWRFGKSGEPFHDIPLLGRRELQRLFPHAEVLSERIGPLTKSIIAAGPRDRLARTRHGAPERASRV